VELFLNLAGALAAIALVCLWLWHGSSKGANGASRRTQLIALVLLILVIFPVISVTDDLLAAASPAETDVLSRRDHIISGLMAATPAVVLPGLDAVPEPATAPLRLLALLEFDRSLPDSPALAPIENRPPPAL
jgi:hypothetical protein